MRSETRPAFTIQSPLFVFDRVFRRTGTIRKTCIFHNDGDDELELQVRYGFKEHSWLQILGAPRALAEERADEARPGERLVLGPGESRVHFLMNTDSSNFPYDRFLGRVFFHVEDMVETPPDHWLEINFEHIDELQNFDGYAAVDIGTSNSTISLYHLRRDAVTGMPWNPELEGTDIDVPSALFIHDFARFRRFAEGSCSVGNEALRDYRFGPANDPRSLQLGCKRLVGSRRVLAADAHGSGGYVSPLDILYMIGRFIRARSQNHPQVSARLEKLMVTFPPTWDYSQIRRWKEVFHRLGYGDDQLDLSLDEASAAALFHIYQWIKEDDSRKKLVQDLLPSWQEVREGSEKGNRYTLKLLSFDFGGGTTDLAFVQSQLTLFDSIMRLRISLMGSDSLPYGGDQVTLTIFRILKRRLAMALSDPERFIGQRSDEEPEPTEDSGFFLLPPHGAYGVSPLEHAATTARKRIALAWQEIEEHLPDEQLESELEGAVDAVFPTRFLQSSAEPLSVEAKRNFGWLWDQAETLKRQLFREANRRQKGILLASDHSEELSAGITFADIPEEIVGRRFRDPELARSPIAVTIGEIYQGIREPIERAVERARRLVCDERIDRVVLTGQSSWIPLVRRLFMRPRSEGGFGLPPSKIVFDAENAKTAVSKGACILRVMRDTLVGFEVDVADFKANLLADMFYVSPVGGQRALFRAGAIDDFSYVEESPDPSSFAEHLAIFYGTASNLLGQFEFSALGEALPDIEAIVARTCAELGEEIPDHGELLRLRERDHPRYVRLASALLEWPERVLIAWMEGSATSGTGERPCYRYYLTRNRNLLAVRDRGDAGKTLYAIRSEDGFDASIPARDNPFSGIH